MHNKWRQVLIITCHGGEGSLANLTLYLNIALVRVWGTAIGSVVLTIPEYWRERMQLCMFTCGLPIVVTVGMNDSIISWLDVNMLIAFFAPVF